MNGRSTRADGFDGSAAVTRSLLGYGVLAGAFYLVVGVTLALTREGFELSQHPLSLLMLGERGWMQRANLLVTGLMVVAAGVGFGRALRGSNAAGRAGALVAVYGTALMVSGIFPPDPMGGFPAGADASEPTGAGLAHLAAGAVGFLCLAAAALVVAGWFAGRGRQRAATSSRVGALVIVAGFIGGGALATRTAGVVLLWLAVVVGWAWLAGTSVALYRIVPHPDADRRSPAPA
jgi:hypothetical protein